MKASPQGVRTAKPLGGLHNFVSMRLAAWTSSHSHPVTQPPRLGCLAYGTDKLTVVCVC